MKSIISFAIIWISLQVIESKTVNTMTATESEPMNGTTNGTTTEEPINDLKGWDPNSKMKLSDYLQKKFRVETRVLELNSHNKKKGSKLVFGDPDANYTEYMSDEFVDISESPSKRKFFRNFGFVLMFLFASVITTFAVIVCGTQYFKKRELLKTAVAADYKNRLNQNSDLKNQEPKDNQ